MDTWVLITIGAAFAQSLRFMLQKQLTIAGLSTAGATFARFVFTAPAVIIIAFGYMNLTDQPFPNAPTQFWVYGMIGATSQILATMCVMALFQYRHFAVGITFKKTEVLLSVLIGFVILGDTVTPLALFAIVVGAISVILLSDPLEVKGSFYDMFANRAVMLGLSSGVLFGLSGVSYRGASLSLFEGDAFYRAMFTMAFVVAFQLITMALWLAWREKGEIKRVFGAWRIVALVGATSMIGTMCWFTAFTLQSAGYVNAVGQIELIFSLVYPINAFETDWYVLLS
jgi:drug/metabolite transporter (DMT)-like permease